MKMTNEQAIEQLQKLIDFWEFIVRVEENDDLQDTRLKLEALRMAAQALKEKLRWIPCAERLPEMYEESDFVLFCDITGIHIGYCEVINNDLVWKTADGQIYNDVAAWMLPPKMYVYEED